MAEPSATFRTRVVCASRGSSSLRVTVPQVVASTLALHAGEELIWNVDPATGQVVVSRAPPSAPPDVAPPSSGVAPGEPPGEPSKARGPVP